VPDNNRIILFQSRHSHFCAFERRAELAASELSRFIETLQMPAINPLDYHVWGYHGGKVL